jgi:hypothetical protein
LARDPARLASHLDLGVKDTAFMQSTVAMTLTAQAVTNTVQVGVKLTNVAAGHHVPTDFPGRHMILAVAATDGQGQALPLQSGPTVPEWGGAQAGQPGKAFAKVLRDVKTGESPVVSYWKQTLIVSDNRIPALGSDTSAYTFAVPADGGEVNVTARLLFRRAFQPLTEAKGWEVEDIVMETEVVTLSLGPAYRIYLPVIMKS